MATKTKNKGTLLLIDGSNLAFRMFFALEMSNLRDGQGNPTWAVYGTLKALFDVIEFTKPSAAAVAFDLPEPTYRHEVFEEYKANRPDEMPDDLQPQWELIKEGFKKFHIPVLEEPGYEADDLIGIMARKAEKDGYKVVILSGDKDLYQLIDDNIEMAVPQRGGGLEVFSTEDVFEKVGVYPEQIPDYKGIAGDSSDNIPGVRGLGPKAAVKLLTEYGTIEGIYENIEKIGPPKTKEKLVDQEEGARLSKHIATIITDEAGIKNADLTLKHCHLDMPDTDALTEFLKDLEFKSIIRRLPEVLKPFNNGNVAEINNEEITKAQRPKKDPVNTDDKWEQIDTPLTDLEVKPFIVADETSLNALIKELEKADKFAVDLETTGLNTASCDIVGWAFAVSSKKKVEEKDIKTFYIPLRHQNIKQLDEKTVLKKLKPILEDKEKLQIIQNAKFEHKIFHRIGIKIHNSFYDTMLASYIDNPANKHGLKQQSKRVYHQRMMEIDEIIGTGRKQITIDQAPMDIVAPYAAADAFMTYKLYLHYEKSLDKREKELLQDFEFPLVEVLKDIELNGVKINTKFLNKLSKEAHQKISEIEAEIHKASGEEFNIASPKQLSEILFSKMGFPKVGKKTKSGGYSTSVGTLETLLNEYELSKKQEKTLENILEFRTLSKLTSTYIDTLPNLINKDSGRVHSDFNQVATTTGRLSSSNPNLQNIPIRSEYGRQIRKAFIPEDGFSLYSADYSQIELRVLAHMAEAEALISAFKNNEDIHRRTAMEIFGINDAEEVTDTHRAIGKTLNFALIYMQGTYSTAKQLDISNAEAKEFIDKYFKAFPSIRPYMNEILDGAREDGYTETLFGRRRYFKNINSPNKILAKEEERQAFNAPLQGTAADIMKIAMINIHEKFKKKKYKSKIILQVHDELVFELADNEADEIKKLVESEMSKAAELQVPLLVDSGTGPNWLECK